LFDGLWRFRAATQVRLQRLQALAGKPLSAMRARHAFIDALRHSCHNANLMPSGWRRTDALTGIFLDSFVVRIGKPRVGNPLFRNAHS